MHSRPPFALLLRAGDRTLAALLMVVFAVLFITMPRVTVRGDPVAIRFAAANLLHNGRIWAPIESADHLGGGADVKGQYFYVNEDSGRLFSKYGVLNTILFVPPLLANWIRTGEADPMGHAGSLVLFLNLYNIAVAMLIAWLLYRIAGLYTTRRGVQCVFVLTSMFATFLWHYLRAQSSEIFQVLFFLGIYDQLVRARRELPAGQQDFSNATRHLQLSLLCAAALTFLKTYYLLLFPLILAFCWVPRTSHPMADSESRTPDLRGQLRWLALHTGIVGGLTITLLLAINAYKFGSPFRTGYGQYQSEWFAVPQMTAVIGYLLRPDRSIFVHYPLLILALAGVVPFFRGHRAEYGFVCCVAVLYFLVFCRFVNWAGHWSYGPRFLLFVVPLLSLPAVGVLEDLLNSGWTTRRALGQAGAVVILGASLWAQVQVNRHSAFLYYDLKSFFSNAKDENVDAYFGHQHFALLAHHVHRYSRGTTEFPPFAMVAEWQTTDQHQDLKSYFEKYTWTNYFWFGTGEPPQ